MLFQTHLTTISRPDGQAWLDQAPGPSARTTVRSAARMGETYRMITGDFSGQWSEEQRLVQDETFRDGAGLGIETLRTFLGGCIFG